MNELEKRAAYHRKRLNGLSPFCSLGEVSENNCMEERGGMPKDSLNEKILTGEKEFALEYDFYNVNGVKITDHDKGVIYASTTDEAIEKFNGLIEKAREFDQSFVCIGKPIFLNDSLIDIGDKYKVYRDGKMIKDNSLVEVNKKKLDGTLKSGLTEEVHNDMKEFPYMFFYSAINPTFGYDFQEFAQSIGARKAYGRYRGTGAGSYFYVIPSEDVYDEIKKVAKNRFGVDVQKLLPFNPDKFPNAQFTDTLTEAEKKRKKRPGVTLNPNAGNVEHNINMFNHMNNPTSGPSTNPNGPMGEAYKKSTVNSYIRDRLNDFYIPEYFSDGTEPNIDKLVTDITNIIKTKYPYMLDYIKYWADAEAAEEAGIGEDFYDLIAYENFPEGLIYEYISTLPGFLGENYLTEEFDYRQEIDLEYEDLFITVYGQQRDVDDWDTWEGKVNWTYTVTAQDIIELVLQDRIDESDLPNIDNMEGEEIDKFIDDHFDELYAKYENDILDYFMDDAKEDAEAHYDPREFDDSADRAYDEYQDRLWDMRESKKTEYNRKDYDDDFDMFLRGI